LSEDRIVERLKTTHAGGRSALLPAAGIPLLYFAFAHLCLAAAFGVLVVQPSLPGAFFLHPRMVAVVHLVTLGWISGSILGAFYIVGPLALRIPLRPGTGDRVTCAAFVTGVAGMISHFWIGEYHGMAWSALLVVVPIVHVALRAWSGLRRAAVPWPVKLHIALAFANMLAASGFGMIVGMNRLRGWFSWSALSAAYAHAHLAAIGWGLMMVVGLSYRLMPMILPAAMPTGASMAVSAILLESGVLILVVALIRGSAWTVVGALLILGGLLSFVAHVRGMLGQRRRPAVAIPRPDWATWQTHGAFIWLLAAAGLGLTLSLPIEHRWTLALGWTYGTLGLIGFLAQIVIGMQGRLLPLHAWYRSYEADGVQPGARSAHTLASPRLAKWTFATWMVGVPILACGLSLEMRPAIIAGAATLLIGVILNAAQGIRVASV
jgi:hypothetical protein